MIILNMKNLIQTKQEVPSLALDSALEGQMGGLEEQVRRDHPHLTLGVSFLLQLALDAVIILEGFRRERLA